MKKPTKTPHKVSFDLSSGKSPFVIKVDAEDFKLPGIFTFVGNTGSGKTYSCVALNKYFEHKRYTTRTFLVSATHPSNPIYKNLSTLEDDDVHDPSVQVLQKILEQVKEMWKKYKEYKEYCKVFANYMKHPDFLTVREQMVLEFNNYEPMKAVERPRCMIIMDDVQGMGMYSQNPNNIITHMTIKHRHIPLSMCFLVQSWTGLPRVLRLNTTVFVLFETSDLKQLTQMYESFGNLVDKEVFFHMFKISTSKYKGFLVVDKEPSDERRRYRDGFHSPFPEIKKSSITIEDRHETKNKKRSSQQSGSSKPRNGHGAAFHSSPGVRLLDHRTATETEEEAPW